MTKEEIEIYMKGMKKGIQFACDHFYDNDGQDVSDNLYDLLDNYFLFAKDFIK